MRVGYCYVCGDLVHKGHFLYVWNEFIWDKIKWGKK